jgi:serine/threonine-protein kinase
VRVCPKCGASLVGELERTKNSRSFDPLKRPAGASASQVRRKAEEPGRDEGLAATAPDDTMADEELVKRKPAMTPTPRAPSSAPRRSQPARPTVGAQDPSVLATGGARDPLIGKKLQEYVLEGRLGVGGMGVVYKAVQPMIGKHVAIKVLRPDVVQDPRDMDRLLEEARVVSSIKHRGIINIFGAGTLEDGRHYLIMELLEGESLEQLMAREGIVPAGDAVIILEQTLSALAAAHEAGIVHRDLKPANIFIVKEANQMYVKLLDFGLARRQSQNVTRIAGTPDYISPEHARGRPAGPPADLYGFGILCFHMLTGKLPFIGTTPMEVMEKHVHVPPPVPHEVAPSIPKALSELILKLLAKDPGERPDASQVKADLRAATRQMRNAATMMSLVAIEPVTADAANTEDKRARELARNAQVADLKRKVTRRWPYVLMVVAGLWLVGVVVYLLQPAKPPTLPVVKRPKDPPVVARPEVDKPVADPVTPVAVKPAVSDPVVPETLVDAGPVAVEPTVPAVSPTVEEDAGVPEEDLNAVVDDVRLGELRRARHIDDHLEEVEAAIKDPRQSKLRAILGELARDARKTCQSAQTMKQLIDCDDKVIDLYDTYRKNL